MKTYGKYALTLSLCAFGLMSSTFADSGAGSSKFMEYFDSNNDNIVTKAELNEASKQRFAKMDTDTNGVVTAEEFQAYWSDRKMQWRERRFTEMDGNGDGQVSKEEYVLYKQKRAEQRYPEMDADGDGTVSKEEYLSRKRGYRGGKHRHGAERFFSKLDSNNDALLTLEESLAAWTDWFNRIDADQDQVVTADEIKAFRDGMRKD